MAQPSTPVSGCPLKRLEVQDDTKVRVYGVGVGAVPLTLTIKHQRSQSSDRLLLVVDAGQRAVLSITLSDLLSPGAGAITAARHTQCLAVTITQQGYEIRAYFDANRDLHLAAHMLSRLGLPVTEDADPESLLSQEQYSAGFNSGPRLSSITPIPGIDTLDSVSHGLPLSSPLNPAFSGSPRAVTQDTRVSGLQSYMAPPGNAVLTNHVQSEAALQRFSPYNLLLNKQSELYRPPVGSPLRNSFSPDAPQPQRYSPAPDNWTESQRSMSLSMASPSFADHALSFASHSSRTSSEARPDTMRPARIEQRNASVSSHESQDTLPERRDLPFVRGAAAKSATTSRPRKKTQEPMPSTQEQGRVRKRGQPTKRPSEAKISGSRKNPARAAKVLSTPPSDPLQQLGGGEGRCDIQSDPVPILAATTVVVAEPGTIGRLFTITSALLDQYEADLSRGCDKGLCARFYLERLHSTRRDFWLRQLSADEGGQLFPPCSDG